MKPWAKGLIIAAVHVGLVVSLGAKMLYDRAMRPRVWTLAVPYDPNLPIRGRYVSLQLVVDPKGIEEPNPERGVQSQQSVILSVHNNKLVAEATPQGRSYNPSDLRVEFIKRQDKKLAVLKQRVAFFITEHILDPSLRPPGEELWVEVTIPKKGPPRPIRMGVQKTDGAIVPLELE